MKPLRKLWIGLLILALLTPLGLLASWLGSGQAWGEWAPETLRQTIGYVPRELQRLAGRWHAPLPDYGGEAASHVGQGAWYIVSAIVGVALVAGLAFLLGRWLARHEQRSAKVDD